MSKGVQDNRGKSIQGFVFTVKPVAVHILNKKKYVTADTPYDVECKSSGSRPAAAMSWWLGTRPIKRLVKHVGRTFPVVFRNFK